MTLDPGIETGRADVRRLAAAARSILSCPADVQLVVDGLDDLTGGLLDAHLCLEDHGGRPVFTCPADSPLAVAATDRRGALLTLTSGLGRPASPDRDATLTLTGRLEATGLEECRCCSKVRMRVALQPEHALLSRTTTPEAHLRVPVGAFTSREHDLNRGFLQRSADHANDCHQDELRRVVATTTDTRLGDVIGVHLVDLRTDGVELQWVDVTGAHRRRLDFGRSASTPHELGELLRDHLHAGLC